MEQLLQFLRQVTIDVIPGALGASASLLMAAGARWAAHSNPAPSMSDLRVGPILAVIATSAHGLHWLTGTTSADSVLWYAFLTLVTIALTKYGSSIDSAAHPRAKPLCAVLLPVGLGFGMLATLA